MTYDQLTYELNKLARETTDTTTQFLLRELVFDLEKNGLSDEETEDDSE